MIVIRQLLARIPKVLLLVPVTLVTRATAKPVASVSCLNLQGTKSIWIACVVNLTLSSLKNTLARKYTSMINAHNMIKKKKWKCNWELEAHWLVGAAGKVSPNRMKQWYFILPIVLVISIFCSQGDAPLMTSLPSSWQLIPRLPYLTITYHNAFKLNSSVVHEKPYYQIQIIHSLQS